jgi:hypothetical protein
MTKKKPGPSGDKGAPQQPAQPKADAGPTGARPKTPVVRYGRPIFESQPDDLKGSSTTNKGDLGQKK